MHKVGGSNDRRAREREEKVQLASAAMPVQIVRAQPRHVLSGSQAHHSTPLFSRLFLLALSSSFILSFFGTFFAFCFDHVFLRASQSRTRHNLYSYLSFLTSLPTFFTFARIPVPVDSRIDLRTAEFPSILFVSPLQITLNFQYKVYTFMFSVNIAHNPNMQPIVQRYDCIPTTLEQKGERTFFPVFHRKSLRTLIIWSA